MQCIFNDKYGALYLLTCLHGQGNIKSYLQSHLLYCNVKWCIYIHIYLSFTSASKLCDVHLLHVYTIANEWLTPALPDLSKVYCKLVKYYIITTQRVCKSQLNTSFTVDLTVYLENIYNHVNSLFRPVLTTGAVYLLQKSRATLAFVRAPGRGSCRY